MKYVYGSQMEKDKLTENFKTFFLSTVSRIIAVTGSSTNQGITMVCNQILLMDLRFIPKVKSQSNIW